MIWRKFWGHRNLYVHGAGQAWRGRLNEYFAAGSSRRTGVVSKFGIQYLIVYLFSHWNPYGTWSINRAIPHFETTPQRWQGTWTVCHGTRSDCWSSATTRAPRLGMVAAHMLSGWWMRWCRTADVRIFLVEWCVVFHDELRLLRMKNLGLSEIVWK